MAASDVESELADAGIVCMPGGVPDATSRAALKAERALCKVPTPDEALGNVDMENAGFLSKQQFEVAVGLLGRGPGLLLSASLQEACFLALQPHADGGVPSSRVKSWWLAGGASGAIPAPADESDGNSTSEEDSEDGGQQPSAEAASADQSAETAAMMAELQAARAQIAALEEQTRLAAEAALVATAAQETARCAAVEAARVRDAEKIKALEGELSMAEALEADRDATRKMAEEGMALLHNASGYRLAKYTQAGGREERVLRITKKRDLMWTEGVNAIRESCHVRLYCLPARSM